MTMQAVVDVTIESCAEGFMDRNQKFPAWILKSTEGGAPWTKWKQDIKAPREADEKVPPYSPGDTVRCRVERGRENPNSKYDANESLYAYYVDVTAVGVQSPLVPEDPRELSNYLMADILGTGPVAPPPMESAPPLPPFPDDIAFPEFEDDQPTLEDPPIERIFDPQVNWESIKDFKLDEQKIWIRQSALDKAVPLITNMMIGDPELWSPEKTLNRVNTVVNELALMVWGQYKPKAEPEEDKSE